MQVTNIDYIGKCMRTTTCVGFMPGMGLLQEKYGIRRALGGIWVFHQMGDFQNREGYFLVGNFNRIPYF